MLWTAKLASAGVLLGTTILSGLIVPYFILRGLSTKCQSSTFRRILSLLNCFSGGVFICTSVLTLLPEAREAMEEAFPTDIEYPLTEAFLVIGFLLILLVESIATTLCQKKPTAVRDSSIAMTVNNADVSTAATPDQNLASHHQGKVVLYTTDNGSSDMPSQSADAKTDHSYTVTSKHVASADGADHVHVDPSSVSSIRSVVLLIALSIHMLFDGLGVGLMDEESEVWSLLAALSIHKILIFFTIGLTIREANSTVKYVIAMIYLALVSPIGVGIGIGMTSQGDDVTMVTISAILQGLAVGTFLYVAIFDILAQEFMTHVDKWRIQKTFSTVIGCVLLGVIKYAMPE